MPYILVDSTGWPAPAGLEWAVKCGPGLPDAWASYDADRSTGAGRRV